MIGKNIHEKIVERFYNEALGSDLVMNPFISTLGESIIYKGFKLFIDEYENDKGEVSKDYYILDARHYTDLSEVTDKDADVLLRHGFVEGVSMLCNVRNERRVKRYKRKVAKLYDKKLEWSEELQRTGNKELHNKRLRVSKASIERYLYLLFLYKSKVDQYHSNRIEKIF